MLKSFKLLISVLLYLTPSTVNRVAAQDAVVQCRNDAAAICSQNALQSVTASGCNWNLIIPLMQQCINEATGGCPTYQIQKWQQAVQDFNETLVRTACATMCPNPDARAAAMQLCFTITDTVTTFQYTELSDLVAYIIRLFPLTNKPACALLGSAIDCLNLATVGCTALMDLANTQLTAMNASLAISACNVSKFVTPTTLEPLAIFNSVSVPDATTRRVTVLPGVLIGEGSTTSQSATWTVLIVLASIAFVVVLVAIVVLLQRTLAYRRQARMQNRLLSNATERSEWLPSTTTTKDIGHSMAWPANPRPRGLRPI